MKSYLWKTTCKLGAVKRIGIRLKTKFVYVIEVLSDRICYFTSVVIDLVWPLSLGVLLWSAC